VLATAAACMLDARQGQKKAASGCEAAREAAER